jgi:hypothetical protein
MDGDYTYQGLRRRIQRGGISPRAMAGYVEIFRSAFE